MPQVTKYTSKVLASFEPLMHKELQAIKDKENVEVTESIRLACEPYIAEHLTLEERAEIKKKYLEELKNR
ncbi:hypothetical protein SAMN02745136_00522 [Anaerocolumna jejuensis DSM 15929]|uniref:Uncharacterized protein n=1 Tax=Anaerocolumna jejuensis DSM 15929 TaxID=1121322 RepID=A0A1M6KP02_9FIRM|nr:hypothetical protein [Anaerocolumna jejuensis]SHJ60584.1 hypothetical protein SAMN02745136_00522 [Anaerocolumna jejuensis DSM 15929]